jgi:shikimate kinase
MAQQTIILIGMSGVGKTYLGRYASEVLRVPFFDTDEIIRDKYNMELRDLVKVKSWTWFRHEEHLVLEELLSASADTGCRIISTGGGIIENPLVFPL